MSRIVIVILIYHSHKPINPRRWRAVHNLTIVNRIFFFSTDAHGDRY
jgi:hypothetical protein